MVCVKLGADYRSFLIATNDVRVDLTNGGGNNVR